MIGHQTGLAILKSFKRSVRELLGSKKCIGRASNVSTSCHSNHVMKGWNTLAQAGKSRCSHRVGMDHRADIGPCLQNIPVKAPFGRGLTFSDHIATRIHKHHGIRGHGF